MRFDVQPIYGWGWSADEHRIEVPGPFGMDTVVNEKGGFRTAVGRLDDPGHLLSAMWIVLSPIQATKTWEWSHVCACPSEPSIPNDLRTLLESAPLTGFAKAFPH